MADIFPLQQDVNRKAALHVYFGPQVAKSRNGVSIIWRAGRPSGWALPRILVFLIFKNWLDSYGITIESESLSTGTVIGFLYTSAVLILYCI